MNLEKVFNFIKDRRGYNYPFKYKLINRIPLSEDELNINGNLDLYGENISLLPDNLTVGGYLILSYTKINSLPDDLKVGGYLNLSNTKITSIPNYFKVNDSLNIYNTPLSKKYSKEQIRNMIEEKGGYVGGMIFT